MNNFQFSHNTASEREKKINKFFHNIEYFTIIGSERDCQSQDQTTFLIISPARTRALLVNGVENDVRERCVDI